MLVFHLYYPPIKMKEAGTHFSREEAISLVMSSVLKAFSEGECVITEISHIYLHRKQLGLSDIY